MGAAALARSAAFTWDRSIDTLERVLKEAVAEGPTGRDGGSMTAPLARRRAVARDRRTGPGRRASAPGAPRARPAGALGGVGSRRGRSRISGRARRESRTATTRRRSTASESSPARDRCDPRVAYFTPPPAAGVAARAGGGDDRPRHDPVSLPAVTCAGAADALVHPMDGTPLDAGHHRLGVLQAEPAGRPRPVARSHRRVAARDRPRRRRTGQAAPHDRAAGRPRDLRRARRTAQEPRPPRDRGSPPPIRRARRGAHARRCRRPGGGSPAHARLAAPARGSSSPESFRNPRSSSCSRRRALLSSRRSKRASACRSPRRWRRDSRRGEHRARLARDHRGAPVELFDPHAVDAIATRSTGVARHRARCRRSTGRSRSTTPRRCSPRWSGPRRLGDEPVGPVLLHPRDEDRGDQFRAGAPAAVPGRGGVPVPGDRLDRGITTSTRTSTSRGCSLSRRRAASRDPDVHRPLPVLRRATRSTRGSDDAQRAARPDRSHDLGAEALQAASRSASGRARSRRSTTTGRSSGSSWRTIRRRCSRSSPADNEQAINCGLTLDDVRYERARTTSRASTCSGSPRPTTTSSLAAQRRFGWWPDGVDLDARTNVSTEDWDVTPAFRDRIAADNAYDLALYEYARSSGQIAVTGMVRAATRRWPIYRWWAHGRCRAPGERFDMVERVLGEAADLLELPVDIVGGSLRRRRVPASPRRACSADRGCTSCTPARGSRACCELGR